MCERFMDACASHESERVSWDVSALHEAACVGTQAQGRLYGRSPRTWCVTSKMPDAPCHASLQRVAHAPWPGQALAPLRRRLRTLMCHGPATSRRLGGHSSQVRHMGRRQSPCHFPACAERDVSRTRGPVHFPCLSRVAPKRGPRERRRELSTGTEREGTLVPPGYRIPGAPHDPATGHPP